ncbi:hypothetical protein [Oceanobacillus salinisoli]|uniref:hypothetical protein n=1 Tax=Oceanobacillus salinisoli TaxID=2678611 RepID=UPI0012E2B940|nr:hypothetical protein [Oceanobacillus salinisoli]
MELFMYRQTFPGYLPQVQGSVDGAISPYIYPPPFWFYPPYWGLPPVPPLWPPPFPIIL